MVHDPKMILRQILLIKKGFQSYPSSEQDTDLRMKNSLETGIWPLVNHIQSFDYPREFNEGIIKLSNFPFSASEEEKWLNKFSGDVNTGWMTHVKTFAEEDAVNMNSSLGEIMNALKAIQKAVPFISINVGDHSKEGKIELWAADKIMQEYNLIKTVGGTD